jgi:hypothetical protein
MTSDASETLVVPSKHGDGFLLSSGASCGQDVGLFRGLESGKSEPLQGS